MSNKTHALILIYKMITKKKNLCIFMIKNSNFTLLFS